MANDRFKTKRSSPWIARIAIGILLALLAGLVAAFVLRSGHSAAEDADTAVAIDNMDAAQGAADERREEKRSASALL